MKVHFSANMRSITISSSNNGNKCKNGLMKIKVASRHISNRILWTVLLLAFLLPFAFLFAAQITLEGFQNCASSLDCFGPFGRRFGPTFLGHADDLVRLDNLHSILSQVDSQEIPNGDKVPHSFNELVSDMRKNHYDSEKFAMNLKAMMNNYVKEINAHKIAAVTNKHFAAIAIPKGIHCLTLLLTDEYSSNARARRQLPPPELLPLLSDNSHHHFVLATDNILAASVVVTSAVQSSSNPEKIVFHVVTDKKTYAGMHSWFALNPVFPSIVEVKGLHQLEWLTREDVPILEALENYHRIRNYYHGNHISGADFNETPKSIASKLEARSSKYISMLNHLRIFLPELLPNIDKVVFLDDDVVVQRDLSPLWDIDLDGKVNGAVTTCKGEDARVMSKHFENYFNYSHPLISQNLALNECPWAYGMNIFDLHAWRKTNIKDIYHFWLKENLKSNLTLWKLGTLPPALIAFRGNVHPIDPSWHMLGLGYQNNTSIESLKKAAVIHYNGQCKPWLNIGFDHLRPFWTKYVNHSNDFIKRCHIDEL